MSSLAISMFGGFDPGEVDESDPVRATAARRLAGMGVDTDAARGAGWPTTAPTGSSPATATGAGSRCSRSRGSTPRSPCRARSWPAGCRRPCTSARHADKGLEVVWPALHGYVRWLAEFCAAAPGAAGRLHADRLPRHGPRGRGGGVGPANGIFGGVMLPAMSVTSRLPGYADDYYEPFWSACEDNEMVVTLHTGASGSATDTQVPLRPGPRRHARPLRGVRLHPPPAVVHDLRRRLRPPSRPQGRGHRERRAVAAVAHPRHGVVLRHPRRRARPHLPQDAARATTSRSTCGSAAR